jgi:hypothetical protein
VVAHGIDVSPIVTAVDTIWEALDAVRETEALFLGADDQAHVLERLTFIAARVSELRARVTTAATATPEFAAVTGATDPAGFLSHATRCGGRQAREATAFAQRLTERPQVAASLRAGQMTTDQADAVCRALEALPHDVPAETVAAAETHLVGLASEFDPRQLRTLGRKVLDVVAPEAAEWHEGQALEREEANARHRTRLSLRRNLDGTTRISGILPDLSAMRLATYLHAFTNPRRLPLPTGSSAPEAAEGATSSTEAPGISTLFTPGDDSGWFRLAPAHRLGEAFCELLERIDPGRLPDHGGASTHLIVTMGLDSLRREVGAATVIGPDGAERISASEARRLACNAGIIPAVLGTRDEPLNLGRSARLASTAQRRALMLTHSTCMADGCDRPVRWCEVHHFEEWAHGGRTDLKDLGFLCGGHHHTLHLPTMTFTVLPNGKIRFHRRE